MEITDPYSIIFQRRSIRNYDLTPLDEHTLAAISEYLSGIKHLYENIRTEIKIISSDKVKRRMMKKAPHYLAVFSEVKDGYRTNVGFMLQQMDLLFSANGIGSCWQGIPKPKKEVLNSSDLEFVILMAFGMPNEPLHRNKVSEFNRKTLPEITNIIGADELLEAARVAPSATNSQSWFFTGDKDLIHAYFVKPGFLGSITKKYIPINIGIALYHLMVATEHFGNTAAIIIDETAKKNPPQGCEYVASLKVE